VIHHVFATKSNIGDWLSAQAIQELISPVEVKEYFCDEPFVEQTLAGLSAAPPNEVIVIGGGGLFMDYFAPFWTGFLEVAGHRNFCIWGVGCCDLKQAESRVPEKLLSEIVSRSRLCFVRDDLTRAYLNKRTMHRAVPCPTMTIIEPTNSGGRGLLYADHYSLVGSTGYEEISAISREFARTTVREYRETDNQIAHGSEVALAATLDLYRTSDVIVSSRLHGCIIGLAMGRKVVAVSGDRKVESFMTAAGLSDWVFNVDDLKSLSRGLCELENQETPWEFIRRVRSDNQAIANQVKAMIAGPEC